MKSKSQIKYRSVILTKLNFSKNKKFVKKSGVPLDVKASFNIDSHIDKKTNILTTALSVSIFKKEKDAPFNIEATIEGTFFCEDFHDLKRFSEVVAPAHLLPFMREVIGNITMRAGVPPLLMPPINLIAAIGHKK